MIAAKSKNIREGHNKNSKTRTLFIICCITLPIIQFLVFYVYTNASSVILAFTDTKGNFTFDNFARFFKEFSMKTSSIRIAFKNTLLTFSILFITFPFKTLVSYFLYRKIPGYRVYRILFFLPMVIFSICTTLMYTRIVGVNSFIAKGIGEWLNLGYTPDLLGDSRFANTFIIIHLLWLGFPGDLIIWGGTFARIPEDMLEAGRVDGTNWWKEFTRIVVPLIWPTLALKMVLLFCTVFSASGAVFLLTRGAYGTMTLQAWQYIQLLDNTSTTAYNYLSAVGLLLSVVAIAISLTVRKITDKYFTDVEY